MVARGGIQPEPKMLDPAEWERLFDRRFENGGSGRRIPNLEWQRPVTGRLRVYVILANG